MTSTLGGGAVQAYNVSAQIVQVNSGGYSPPTTVQNTGANALYLSEQPNFSILTGVLLNPGASVPWDAGRDLYLLATNALPTTAKVFANQGPINDPSAIASALIAAGLANQIAVATNTLGIPPTNKFTVIYSQIAASWTGAPIQTPNLFVNSYNAVEVGVFLHTASSVAAPTIRSATFQWFSDNAGAPGTLLWLDEYYFTDDNNVSGSPSPLTVITPIRGAWLIIVFKTLLGGGTALQLTTTVTGRYLGSNLPAVSMGNAYAGASGLLVSGNGSPDNFWWISGAKVAGIALQDYPYVQNGDAVFSCRCITAVTGATMEVVLLDLLDNKIVGDLLMPVSAALQVQSQRIILSNRPVTLFVQGGASACTNFQASISYIPN